MESPKRAANTFPRMRAARQDHGHGITVRFSPVGVSVPLWHRRESCPHTTMDELRYPGPASSGIRYPIMSNISRSSKTSTLRQTARRYRLTPRLFVLHLTPEYGNVSTVNVDSCSATPRLSVPGPRDQRTHFPAKMCQLSAINFSRSSSACR